MASLSIPAATPGQHSIAVLVARHFRTAPKRVAGLTILSLTLAASAIVPAVIVAHIVDRAIGGILDFRAALIAGAAIALLAAWDACLTLTRRKLAIATEIDMRDTTATAHFRAATKLPIRDYAGGNEAGLIRSFDDLDRVVEFVATRSVELGAEAMIVAASAALMLHVEWRLALVFLLLALLGLGSAARLAHAVQLAVDAWLPARDARFGFIVECITSMLTIKTLNAHQLVVAPFRREQAAEQEKLREYRERIAEADAATRFWSTATPGVGTVCGAIMLIGGALSAGELLLFLSVSAGLNGSLAALHTHVRELQEARAALDRLRATGTGRPEPLPDDPPAGCATPGTMPLRVNGLGFRHPGAGGDTLEDIAFSIAPAEHVAIVGRSGAGKTTLAHLLARLLAPDRGEIAAGDAAAQTLERYRRAVLLVPHDAHLFNASVRDNVRLWDPSVGDAAVWSGLRRAALGDQVAAWSGGLDAPLGARGNPLSAGQRQRLGLARVFIRRPRVLILDEATSAMDMLTEREVLDNLRTFMRDGVLIVITHREAVAETFHRVLRIDRGRIAADRPGNGREV